MEYVKCRKCDGYINPKSLRDFGTCKKCGFVLYLPWKHVDEEKYAELEKTFEPFLAYRKKIEAINDKELAFILEGKCADCGGDYRGLLFRKCKACGNAFANMYTSRAPSLSIHYNYGNPCIRLTMGGNSPTYGRYVWESLEIRSNRVLVISDYVLFHMPYHKKEKNITWEECSLRKYLNKNFYNGFNVDEKPFIVETRIENKDNPWYGTKGGNATTDKIFLLSVEEVVKYYGDSGDLKNKRIKSFSGLLDNDGGCIFDQYNSERSTKCIMGNETYWWLRTPGEFGSDAAYVGDFGRNADNGAVDVRGERVSKVNHLYGGVRLAMWLEF